MKVWPFITKFIALGLLVIASHVASIAFADEPLPPSVFKKMAYDLEVGGTALENWISTVVDLDAADKKNWRHTFFSNSTREYRIQVLETLNLDDPIVLKHLNPKVREALFEGLTETSAQSKLIHENLGGKKVEILGPDGKPFSKEIILPENHLPTQTQHQIYVPAMEVPKNQLGTEAQRVLVDAQARGEILRTRWKKILSETHPKVVAQYIRDMPLKAYSSKARANFLVRTQAAVDIVTVVKPNQPFLNKVIPGLDGNTLELRVDGVFENKKEYEDQLRTVARRLGVEKSIYQPQSPGAEKNGSFHFHGEFQDDILDLGELKTFMGEYKVKNGLEASFYKANAFSNKLNSYYYPLRARGNVREVSKFHYELRELPYSPEETMAEFEHYFEGLKDLPKDQRLNVALKRLHQKTAETVAAHPEEMLRTLKEIEFTGYADELDKEEVKQLAKTLLRLSQSEVAIPSAVKAELFYKASLSNIAPEETKNFALSVLNLKVKAGPEMMHACGNYLFYRAGQIADDVSNHLKPESFKLYGEIYERGLHTISPDRFPEPMILFKKPVEKRLSMYATPRSLHYNFQALDSITRDLIEWNQLGFHSQVEETVKNMTSAIVDGFEKDFNRMQVREYSKSLISVEKALQVRVPELDTLEKTMRNADKIDVKMGWESSYDEALDEFKNRAPSSCGHGSVTGFFKRIFR